MTQSDRSIRSILHRDNPPDPATRRAARRNLAAVALDDDDPAGALREVLDALGLAGADE